MNFRATAPIVLGLALAAACADDDSSSDATTATTATTTGGGGGGGSTTQGAASSGGAMTTGGAETTGGADGSTSGGAATDESGTTAGAAGPTWTNFASGFFESYCWECHGAGDAQGRDFTLLAGVLAESDAIRCGTAPAMAPAEGCGAVPPAAQFPIGNTLPTDEERAMLVEWFDAGAPEN